MNNTLPIFIASLMSLEATFSCFNGPAFDPNAISWNVDSDIIYMCESCGGSIGCEE